MSGRAGLALMAKSSDCFVSSTSSLEIEEELSKQIRDAIPYLDSGTLQRAGH